MQYLLLIYGNDMGDADMGSAEMKQILEDYAAFNEEIKVQGQHVGSNALQSIATATTVRVRDRETLVTDGPFAETKEVLGGYYLIECNDLDEAIAIASKIPGAKHGSIEVRPIMSLE